MQARNMSKPEDYPEIVYKYRNWFSEFNKAVLTKNELFMASPKYFNDPFDCRIPINYKTLNTPEKVNQYALEFVDRHKAYILRNGLNVQNEIKSLTNDFTNHLDEMQSNHEKILFTNQDKFYGVLSMSARWDSILMWSHYGDFHKGYCIGFWEEKMRNSRFFGKGGPVHYNPDNSYPLIDPLSKEGTMINAFKETHTKAFDWQYEDEYRFFNLYTKDPTDDDRKVNFPNSFIAEIILGIMMPESDKKEIIEIAKKKGIKVFQAKKVPFHFEIGKEEILI